MSETTTAKFKTCTLKLKQKCITQLLAIGGRNSSPSFKKLNSDAMYRKLSKDVVHAVQHVHNVDGIAIDDPSKNCENTFSPENTIAYLTSIKNAFARTMSRSDSHYIIAWNEHASSIECLDQCERRCFDGRIAPLVTWVNLKLYDDVDSIEQLDSYLYTVVPYKWTTVLSRNQIVLAGCIGNSELSSSGVCNTASGPAPLVDQLIAYGDIGASGYCGSMLYTGSADVAFYEGKHIRLIGEAGNYSVNL